MGCGELVFNGDRVSIWNDEKFLEMNGDDVCTVNNVNMLHAAELHA